MKKITNNNLEKKLRNNPKLKILRKEQNHNQLNRYCRLMDYHLEVGFFYNEAKRYTLTMLKRER